MPTDFESIVEQIETEGLSWILTFDGSAYEAKVIATADRYTREQLFELEPVPGDTPSHALEKALQEYHENVEEEEE